MEEPLSTAPTSKTRVFGLWSLSILVLALISWLDYSTGYNLDMFAFYFIPVWLLGWYIGFASSLTMAFLAGAAWFAADQLSGHVYTNSAVGYWNGAMEFGACAVVAVTTWIGRRQVSKYQQLNAQLSLAATRIGQLRGLLHICESCKSIRNEQGEWETVESYLKGHAGSSFSQKLCPDCTRDRYLR